jgi:RNA polymerase sigma-70 factor (ECF subfamily)
VSQTTPSLHPPAAGPWEDENRCLADFIARARAGDIEAFEQLYDRTARWLLSHVRRIVDDGQAEDVLAEVYVQVWRGLASYDPLRAAPGVWLTMIARSRALDHLRREKRSINAKESARLDASVEGPDADGPEQLLSTAQRCSMVQLSMGSAALTADERTALGLAYFREYSVAEIATATGWTTGTVRTVLARAQDKLRTEIIAAPAARAAGYRQATAS